MHSLFSLRKCARGFLVMSLLALAAAGPIGIGSATAEDGEWSVSGKLLGEPRDPEGDDFKKSKDVSGIACDTARQPWLCLVVDDETQGAQIVVIADGTLVAGGLIHLIGDIFRNEPMELDAEAVTFRGDAFYVIGSRMARPF